MLMENSKLSTIDKTFSPSDYFDGMRNASEIVKPRITQIIQETCRVYPELSDDFCFYYAKRVISKKLLLRPFIFKVFLELYNIDWEDHLDIADDVAVVRF